MNPNPDQRHDLNKEPTDRLVRIDHLSPGYEVVSINQPQFLELHEPNLIRSCLSRSSYSWAMSPDCGRSLGYRIDPDMNCGTSLLLALPEDVLALVSGLLNPVDLCNLSPCYRSLNGFLAKDSGSKDSNCIDQRGSAIPKQGPKRLPEELKASLAHSSCQDQFRNLNFSRNPVTSLQSTSSRTGCF
ncbi:hypothetical protein EJ110_NYTH54894 [Nymphaea thermarum]|nr:hypothetical protein EJ110_NYTH54894 [Nymphaea thermarum]